MTPTNFIVGVATKFELKNAPLNATILTDAGGVSIDNAAKTIKPMQEGPFNVTVKNDKGETLKTFSLIAQKPCTNLVECIKALDVLFVNQVFQKTTP